MNIKNMSIGSKIILVASLLVITSMFMPWINSDFADDSLMGVDTGLKYLAVFVYPAFAAFKNEGVRGKAVFMVLAIINALFIYFYIKGSDLLSGLGITSAGIGSYTALIASVALAVGCNVSKEKAEKEVNQ